MLGVCTFDYAKIDYVESFNYSNFDSRPGSNDSSDRNTVASVGLAGPSPTTGEPRRLI